MEIRQIIARQYCSSLAMLDKAIELCPAALWLEGSPNRYWHIAYHTLFYTHLYLAPTYEEFVPWTHHRDEYNYLGEIPNKSSYKPQIDQPYLQAELREYLQFCLSEVGTRTDTLDLTAPSGFFWIPFDKLELQFYNIRHISHHTGQLSERLRTHAGIGLPWVR